MTTRNLPVHEWAVPQQFSPTTEQFRAFRVVDLPINRDGKETQLRGSAEGHLLSVLRISGGALMRTLWQDLRTGIRMLVRSPGLTRPPDVEVTGVKAPSE
jgi:hypothetical protein